MMERKLRGPWSMGLQQPVKDTVGKVTCDRWGNSGLGGCPFRTSLEAEVLV